MFIINNQKQPHSTNTFKAFFVQTEPKALDQGFFIAQQTRFNWVALVSQSYHLPGQPHA
jgi:hypothetical protein